METKKKMGKIIFGIVALIVLIILICFFILPPSSSVCGDDACDEGETFENCPQDCPENEHAPQNDSFETPLFDENNTGSSSGIFPVDSV